MKFKILFFWFFLAGLNNSATAGPIPKPPVTIRIFKSTSTATDGTHLENALPQFITYFQQRGLTVDESEGASWRIEIRGSIAKVFGAPDQSGFTLRLTAFDNSNPKPICQTTFTSSPKVPLSELAMATVDRYLNPPELAKSITDKEQKKFFDDIDRYFYAKGGLASSRPASDTSRPTIEIYSPRLTAERGMARLAKVQSGITVEVIGKVSDMDGKVSQLTLNGSSVEFDPDGRFESSVTVTSESYPILLEARDAAGNSGKMRFIITPETLKRDKQQEELSKKTKPDKRLALVIGNGAYTYVPALTNPINDAEAMKAALESVKFDVIILKNGDQKAIKQAMNEFSDKLRREDYTVGLFYYAGHGIQRDGLNYIVPIDIHLDDNVGTDCVEVQRVLDQMEEANTRTNIIILDACRDDPLKKEKGRNLNGGGGQAFMEAPTGTLIAFATSPGKTAADGTGANGTYTAALLHQIQVPNLSISAVFQNVRKEVQEKTKGMQKPWESTSLTDEFYFRH
ncbi:caspase family protein [Larkinella rosea]|uniref:Caspase family protein n=1 Tax=Larkinella rosea TaxID=2025312 RepID=A0A3P1C1P5_9BACT|nr:caspase family protein [Larkinella rosea]RRB07212.1 caspase family protein [Larkinella rosea]